MRSKTTKTPRPERKPTTDQLIENTKREIMPKIARLISRFDEIHKTSNLSDEQVYKIIRSSPKFAKSDEEYDPAACRQIAELQAELAKLPSPGSLRESRFGKATMERVERNRSALKRTINQIRVERLGWLPEEQKP